MHWLVLWGPQKVLINACMQHHLVLVSFSNKNDRKAPPLRWGSSGITSQPLFFCYQLCVSPNFSESGWSLALVIGNTYCEIVLCSPLMIICCFNDLILSACLLSILRGCNNQMTKLHTYSRQKDTDFVSIWLLFAFWCKL